MHQPIDDQGSLQLENILFMFKKIRVRGAMKTIMSGRATGHDKKNAVRRLVDIGVFAVDSLVRSLKESHDFLNDEYILDALSKIKDPKSFRALSEYALGSAYYTTRVIAIHGLASYKTSETLAALEKIHDANTGIATKEITSAIIDTIIKLDIHECSSLLLNIARSGRIGRLKDYETVIDKMKAILRIRLSFVDQNLLLELANLELTGDFMIPDYFGDGDYTHSIVKLDCTELNSMAREELTRRAQNRPSSN